MFLYDDDIWETVASDESVFFAVSCAAYLF